MKNLTQKTVGAMTLEKYFWNNKNAEWLKDLRSERNEIKQGKIQITTEMVSQQTRKVLNWKCPGLDGVQGYWLKNFPT